MTTVTIKPGDMLEAHTPKGLAYIQYVGRHREYGDVIRVFQGHYDHRCTNLIEVALRPAYIAFYSARAAVKQGLVEYIATVPLAEFVVVPSDLRRAAARARSGKVLTWIVESGTGESLRHELSESERELPIAAVWDHELLIERISTGWTPAQEV